MPVVEATLACRRHDRIWMGCLWRPEDRWKAELGNGRATGRDWEDFGRTLEDQNARFVDHSDPAMDFAGDLTVTEGACAPCRPRGRRNYLSNPSASAS